MCAANNNKSFGLIKNTAYIVLYFFIQCHLVSENIEFNDGGKVQGDVCCGFYDFVAAVFNRKAYVGKVIEVGDTDVYVPFLTMLAI